MSRYIGERKIQVDLPFTLDGQPLTLAGHTVTIAVRPRGGAQVDVAPTSIVGNVATILLDIDAVWYVVQGWTRDDNDGQVVAYSSVQISASKPTQSPFPDAP